MKLFQSVMILCVYFTFQTVALAQQKHGEMALGDIETLSTVVRGEGRSVLIILSEVPNLQFESTRQIFEVREIRENEWQLHLEPGRQIVTIRSSGYLPLKTEVYNFQVKRAFRIKVSQVRPVPGVLIIKTNPDSADLRINGAPINARTPYTIAEAPPGSYYVQIFKSGYRSEEVTLNVKSNETTEWEMDLTQTAVAVRIDIEDGLAGVGIIVDGEAMGIAPGVIFLEPGTHLLMLQKPGYEYAEEVLEVVLGMEEIHLVERLHKKGKSVLKRWWFWTGAVAAGAGTFLLSQKGPPPPELPEPPNFPTEN